MGRAAVDMIQLSTVKGGGRKHSEVGKLSQGRRRRRRMPAWLGSWGEGMRKGDSVGGQVRGGRGSEGEAWKQIGGREWNGCV